MKIYLQLLAVVSCIVMLSAPAHSDLLLSLQDTNRTVIAGQTTTLHFIGTLTNTGSTEMSGLKGMGAMLPYDWTTKVGLHNSLEGTYLWPSPLAPGQSYTGEIFRYVVDGNAAIGHYDAYVRIDYHPNGKPIICSNNVNWSVSVVTPEPSSILVIFSGLAGVAVIFHHRKITIRPAQL